MSNPSPQQIIFRKALRDDVPAILALLQDDSLGTQRESDEMSFYLAAFDRMQAEHGNTVIVGEQYGRIIATYQLTFITGLSRRATRRAQVESVRVHADLRGQGIGAAMMADAETRARAAGCGLIQLTTDATRDRAQRFYETLGFTPSHIGYKRKLD
jgi:GNAT superfamily N-acetyltransferase